MPLPPIANQMQIVEKLDASAKKPNVSNPSQKKLTALEALKKSLLHQAFSGQL